MADENIVRSYRSVGPARRPGEPMPARDVGSRDVGSRDVGARAEAPRSDPLAELARLIGQSDPFADPAPASSRSRAPSPPQTRPDPAPASDWRATAAALAREAMRSPPKDDQPYDPPYDPPYEDADPQVERINSAIATIDSYRTAPDPHYAELEQSPDEHEAGSHYDEAPYQGVSDENLYAEAAEAEPQESHEEPNYFFDGEVPPPDPDQRFYDDPPRTRRGNGLVTAAVLVGCALLGTAGAYGYRSFYAGTRATDAPIISADPTPSKVVPASASLDPAKPVQGDKSPNERIVAHAEEPVTLGAPSPAPRVVLPAPFAPTQGAKPPTPPTSTSASTSSMPAPANGAPEPKKVRTVTIKPEGPDAGMRPLTTASTPPAQASLPAPPAPARPAPAAKPAPQPRSNGGPLSLEPRPQGSEPAAAAAAPAERAPKLASVSSGGYVVQLSSQRSEAEAQASFRSLQAKYPHELGGRDALIQRADTGEKGIRFRATVGPFGSMADAEQFCSRLKAAGGDCFSHKN